MKFVIKLGGATLDNEELLKHCTKAIADLAGDGHLVTVVHGGGMQISKLLGQLNKKTEFISGLRVTDEETRDIALMVLSGKINKMLVSALNASGVEAVGFSGGDKHTLTARRKTAIEGLGFVGEIVAVDPKLLEVIWTLGAVPVISPIALGRDNQYYNVNADEAAASCAAAIKADVLVFLTDVPGVKNRDDKVIRWLSIDEISQLKRDGIISGGMVPKLNACSYAVSHGVTRTHILPAEAAERLPDLCNTRVDDGTEILLRKPLSFQDKAILGYSIAKGAIEENSSI